MKIENTTYHKEIAYKVLSLPPVSEAIVEEENVFVHRCPVPLAFWVGGPFEVQIAHAMLEQNWNTSPPPAPGLPPPRHTHKKEKEEGKNDINLNRFERRWKVKPE